MKALQDKKLDVKELFVTECLELLKQGNPLECVIRCRKDLGENVRTYHMKYEAFLNGEEEPSVYREEEFFFRAGYPGFYSITPFNHALKYIREELSKRRYRLLDEDIREIGDSLISRAGFRVSRD